MHYEKLLTELLQSMKPFWSSLGFMEKNKDLSSEELV